MDLGLAPEDETFRQEVRAFLDAELTPELREAGSLTTSVFTDKDWNLKWHKILHAKGWVAPHWPKEHGGTGWSEMQRYIFAAECSRAGAPALSPMGLRMCGPMLMGFGTDEQKAKYLPRILSGDDYWCQGYSEPGSGSDLASLKCRADSDGDDYVINGTKIWTTHAHFANRMFCLVRTDASGKPQQGITFVLIDMDTPGISVEPIITMAGEHEVNQVFFDNVRVPKANRVGEENDGWTVAKYLLEFERGGAYAPGLRVAVEKLKALAGAEADGAGGSLLEGDAFKRKLAAFEVELDAQEITEHRVMTALSNGQNPGPASSMLKVVGTEMRQKLDTLAVEAIGTYAMPMQPDARQPGSNVAPVGPASSMTVVPTMLNNRASSIYGGSNEIQRGIMAKLVLGL
ncbi:acyl-CoA dehydrogenase family protein [Pyruvatibacter sp.]|uniref:acyl-CoA dehydrogenase family protein n=1 Tax=Pyruvatibacter sp. TaxID=1981328 RepID=UPI0032EDFA02